jgi:hypothetical protein
MTGFLRPHHFHLGMKFWSFYIALFGDSCLAFRLELCEGLIKLFLVIPLLVWREDVSLYLITENTMLKFNFYMKFTNKIKNFTLTAVCSVKMKQQVNPEPLGHEGLVSDFNAPKAIKVIHRIIFIINVVDYLSKFFL